MGDGRALGTIHKSGDSLHTVTITVPLITAVTGTVTYNVSGGLQTGEGTSGTAAIGVTGQQPSGGTLEVNTGFTLKLVVVEDNS